MYCIKFWPIYEKNIGKFNMNVKYSKETLQKKVNKKKVTLVDSPLKKEGSSVVWEHFKLIVDIDPSLPVPAKPNYVKKFVVSPCVKEFIQKRCDALKEVVEKKSNTSPKINQQQDDNSESDSSADFRAPIVEKEKQTEIELWKSMTFTKKEQEKFGEYPEQYWCHNKHTFPYLSRVFRQIAPVPATSCEVERGWSLAGFIVGSRRYRMNPESIRVIVLQHIWLQPEKYGDYFDNIEQNLILE